jgi:uncharacterized protein
MHQLLIYDLAEDYMERRAALREAHLSMAWEAQERGDLILGGALADPADRAVLLFRGPGPEEAEAFARSDPYVLNGLVRRWEVRGWLTVVGDQAAAPLRPERG